MLSRAKQGAARALTTLGFAVPGFARTIGRFLKPQDRPWRRPASEHGVSCVYRILLGRSASPRDIAAKAGAATSELLERAVASSEFRANVAVPLATGDEGLPHIDRLSRTDFEEAQAWAASQFACPAFAAGEILEWRWRRLAAGLLLTSPELIRIASAAHPKLNRPGLQAILARSNEDEGGAGRSQEPDAHPLERALFAAALGRLPNDSVNLAERAALDWRRQLAILLRSDEFSSKVLDALIEGAPPPHLRLADAPPADITEPLDSAFGESFGLNFRGCASWGDLLDRLLRDEVATAALEGQGDAQADRFLKSRIALASFTLSAGEFDPYVSHVEIESRTRLRIMLRNWRSSEPPRIEAARLDAAASPIAVSAVGLQAEAGGVATICVKLGEAAPESGFSLRLVPDAGRQAPPFLVGASLDDKEAEERLDEIRRLLRAEERPRAVSKLSRLIQQAPFYAQANYLAFEEAMWRRDQNGAMEIAARFDPEDDAANRLLLRAAFWRGDEAAAGFFRRIASPSPVDEALAGDSPQQEAARAFIADVASRRAKDAPGLDAVIEGAPSNALAGAALLEAAFADPADIVHWIGALPEAEQNEVVRYFLKEASPAAAMPVLCHLVPDQIPERLTLAQRIALSREASRADKMDAAFEWIREPAASTQMNGQDRIGCAYVLRGIRLPAARAIASDMFEALHVQQASARYAEIIAGLERDLFVHDPLRPRDRFEARSRESHEHALRAYLAQPDDHAARHRLAKSFQLVGKLDEAAEILESILEASPDDPEILQHYAQICDRLGRYEEAARACAWFLDLQYKDSVAVLHIRALRALDRASELGALFEKWLPEANAHIRAEYARNFFFIGDFSRALAEAEQQLAADSMNRQARVIAISAAIELGDYDRAERHLSEKQVVSGEIAALEKKLFRYAIEFGRSNYDAALDSLNGLFDYFGAQHLCITPENGRLGFDNLGPSGNYLEPKRDDRIGPDPLFDGPLVSVIMTAYNSEKYIRTAIRSILDQSYRNIELIVVDDCSSDSTPDILREFERRDSRVRVILKSTNDGTYVSKNMGLLQARGAYVALQDSDDWSHPDRIAKSVAALEANPRLIGLTTDWLRMTSEGEIVIKSGGQISHVCCISLVFRREPAVEKAGFFDSVRIEADMEYIRRLNLLFGEGSVARLRWPLLMGRAHSSSLTASEEYGITRTGFTQPRLDYQAASKAWHTKISSSEADGLMPFPLADRRFDAPEVMLPDRPRQRKG